jgi:hypothetical protein
MWVFIGMIPLSLLYFIRPFQRLNCGNKSLAHVCFVLQIMHCNIYGFLISIGKLSFVTTCYITTTLIEFVATVE